MIKRAYIIHADSALAKRAVALDKREAKGKPFFTSKEEWEAELQTDWQEWNKEACDYIVHIYGDHIAGKTFLVTIQDGNVYFEENDVCYTNEKQPRSGDY
ncbi:hypothetical protein VH12019_00319 [Vibrio phage VH1_2019]|nr:hypothetical protein pp2_053 [Vibrio phage phi-pp2]QHJ74238.1 hypothetical protein VH12019_00319 [Vibrio phage VH1_2019]QIW90980.1 hypothetical protein COHAPHLL_00117 [Vibrio phage V09]UNA01952.1 hypothetical protein [Vibrio phage PC-Liy1]URQ03249.1 hypothetical protein PVA8_263 [Vibrio phage PVA8]WBM58984.1 hypothetical protein vBValMPVA8_262 [Vibrio phage vB_ValM_PVA8]WOL24966.1 hypothetical protein [Vibrio phage PG216]